MKPLLLFTCGTACVAALGAPAPEPFPAAKIDSPALPLLEAARQRAPTLANAPTSPVLHRNLAPAARQRRISRMPVIPPGEEVDHAMRVVPPDESIDYKMLVKHPDLETINGAD